MSTHKITRKCSIYVDGKVIDVAPGDTIDFTGPEPIEIQDQYLKSCLISFDKLLKLRNCQPSGCSAQCDDILSTLILPFDSKTRSPYTNAYMRGIIDDKIRFDVAAAVTPQLACYVIHGILTAVLNLPDITDQQYKNAITYCVRCLELTPEFYNIYKTNMGVKDGSKTGRSDVVGVCSRVRTHP